MQRLSKHLEKTASGLGRPSRDIEAKIDRNLAEYRRGSREINEAIGSPYLSRCFISMYLADPKCRERNPLDDLLLAELARQLSDSPGHLARIYFDQFDRLSLQEALRQWLTRSFEALGSSGPVSRLNRANKAHASVLFSPAGPRGFVEAAYQIARPPMELARSAALPLSGRFHDLVQLWHYVEAAKQVEMGDLDAILENVPEKNIKEQPLEDRMLGHFVVEALAMRCLDEGHLLPEGWLKYILKIAGDPRMPATSRPFQRWWQQQAPAVTRVVKSALAQRDLRFFLHLLETFARREGGDIERMYPARRQFMEGLLKTQQIEDALLILSQTGRDYIRLALPPEERKTFRCSILHNAEAGKCMIYLKLPAGHLVEGSHNSMFRLYSADHWFPNRLEEKRPKDIYYSEITGSGAEFEQRHYPEVRWQFMILRELGRRNYGLAVDPEEALSPTEYKTMLDKHGLP